jgi:hypothetical protein
LLPVALIIGLFVLISVFGGVVSVLGGLAMTGLVCFAPLVIIGVIIAAILKDQQQKAGASAMFSNERHVPGGIEIMSNAPRSA